MNPLESINTLGFTLAAFARPRLGREHMRRYQLRKLKSLLGYAAEHDPFYRRWFEQNGFSPGEVNGLQDIANVPPLDKQHLRELRDTVSEERIARERLIEHKTSGSTGMPVRILRSPAEERRLNMLRWRLQRMLGLRPGDRLAKVKTTWEPLSDRFNRPQDLARKLRLLDTRVFDCFEDPAESHSRLLEFQPHILSGYPGALVRIALEHARRDRPLACLRRVSSGGEALTPHQRRILEESFGVPVHDVYGTSECNVAAWRCPETGLYHVNDDGIVLEVCRDGVPVAEGQTGEIHITSLHSRTMPIIRYAMGDLAVAGPDACPCGSPFSTIGQLRGRTIDFLHLPDGRLLHPFELMNEVVAIAADWIVEYQLVQLAVDRLQLRLVPRRAVDEREQAQLRAALEARLGSGVEVELELTDHIERGSGGKLHFCRSEIQAIPQRS